MGGRLKQVLVLPHLPSSCLNQGGAFDGYLGIFSDALMPRLPCWHHQRCFIAQDAA
eukprot:CAMPEP_0172672518 /NCGR_PEP_ID=MMETSP1074-20121228/11598_1 /TAXON_ID=2916 /ORGANISM="Ceratium fusus, Strain PA161109" /LENGTH=55 /DNA_ID=CAMNT_0013489721 /DNA_START=62 /DNA_END=225 /DNA_ORIENTATION=-